MKNLLLWTLFFLIMIFPLQLVIAVEPDEILKDTVLESRARDISSHLRCPVCQNQSIDDSESSLACDLRFLIRERLKMGHTNQQVIDFLVERYGTFILLKPPFNKATWFLWLSPLVILIIGASIIFFRIRCYKSTKK
ncbi:cytochrome c-type biogenesis protein [Bartonella vinsonii]|uniref:Cytochrome c-type biogenesis protein n=1 Tax=Bartonella vinsonii subsp. berkhoffii str. Tweed TaxID=1094502 RepID=N6UXR8_BARVB|nr:cytochrome c-type biogenesis protein [Bartonella vinsonii]AGF75556.1 cytochrome c-type biogenesis protein cycL [Bartonella vinsonii subsp. berkhoffii str. Winnie]ENN94878.1 cytochrome c-type biogenesis protein cycL [Bartonella vinsonii subsp. berkhoffii str. Tweed]